MRKWICLSAGAAALLLTACNGNPAETVQKADGNYSVGEEIDGSGRQTICADGNLELSVDFDTLNVIVTDKTNGREWSTNPLDADSDPIANAEYLPRLKAQFELSYLANRSLRNIDSYSECVEKEQYHLYRMHNGVRIEYTLGDLDLTVEDIPKKLSAERADSLILKNTKLTDEQKNYFKKCYDQDQSTLVWNWKPNNFGSKVNDLLQVFQAIGYTSQDLSADCKQFGLEYTATEKIGFRIPVEYTLQDDVFRISAVIADMEYPEEYPVLNISLCPYFGAAASDQDGYVFVPDGSGALIDFDHKEHHTSQVELPVYTDDQIVGKPKEQAYTQPVLLPVFGLKSGSTAFLAVIEEGDALSKIVATRAGQNSSYNTVGASFTLQAQDTMDLSSISSGAAEVNVLQKAPYQGRLTLAYRFLNGNEAGYAGMARTYRQYLLDNKGYHKVQPSGLPLYIETIGAAASNKNFLGINYRGTTALTTYAQVKAIKDSLKTAGIDNLYTRLTGWFNTGYEQTVLNEVKPVAALGSRKQLNEILSDGKTYLDAGFMTVSSSNGVSLSTQAARTIDQRYARFLQGTGINKSDNTDENNNENEGYILSVNHLPAMVSQLLKGTNPYQSARLSISDLGNAVYADYNRRNEINCQAAADLIAGQVEKLSQSRGSLMLKEANARTAMYADQIVYAPIYSSGYFTEDREVPFYEMVLHGMAGIAASPMNLSSSYETDLLKAAECGTGLYYQFTYQDLTKLSGMLNMDLYSVCFQDWADRCIADYRRLAEVCGNLNSLQIVDHLFYTDTCTITVYEGGTSVAVNYSSQPVTVNGQTVSGRSFAVLEEGRP